ncbi:hypothetical protein GQ53DRAFT_747634 [Thozetella sp. PMI_491]|nr:hypothetical protein GQ53DRAFT_747634 [Thozetella sp. PMI_491]
MLKSDWLRWLLCGSLTYQPCPPRSASYNPSTEKPNRVQCVGSDLRNPPSRRSAANNHLLTCLAEVLPCMTKKKSPPIQKDGDAKSGLCETLLPELQGRIGRELSCAHGTVVAVMPTYTQYRLGESCRRGKSEIVDIAELRPSGP